MLCIASDHAGFALKNAILAQLRTRGHDVDDLGSLTPEPCPYPAQGHKAAEAVAAGRYEKGILICGTGAGIAMAAGKHPGIRCACVSDTATARLIRAHNDANMLALGARIVGEELAVDIVDAFLRTPFSGEERHRERIAMIEVQK